MPSSRPMHSLRIAVVAIFLAAGQAFAGAWDYLPPENAAVVQDGPLSTKLSASLVYFAHTTDWRTLFSRYPYFTAVEFADVGDAVRVRGALDRTGLCREWAERVFKQPFLERFDPPGPAVFDAYFTFTGDVPMLRNALLTFEFGQNRTMSLKSRQTDAPGGGETLDFIRRIHDRAPLPIGPANCPGLP